MFSIFRFVLHDFFHCFCLVLCLVALLLFESERKPGEKPWLAQWCVILLLCFSDCVTCENQAGGHPCQRGTSSHLILSLFVVTFFLIFVPSCGTFHRCQYIYIYILKILNLFLL